MIKVWTIKLRFRLEKYELKNIRVNKHEDPSNLFKFHFSLIVKIFLIIEVKIYK